VGQLPPKKIVDVVLTARRNQETNREILDKLVQLGVEPFVAPSLLEAVDGGFKSGACSLSAHGLFDSNSPPEADPVFKLACVRGKAAMQGKNGLYVLAKLVLPWILMTAALTFLWYLALIYS
jgi:hypothetical protein